MRTEAVLLMVILSQCSGAISEKSLRLIIGATWFEPILIKVNESGIAIFPLIIDLMSSCIQVIERKTGILPEAKELVLKILEKIHFNDDEAEQLFRLVFY